MLMNRDEIFPDGYLTTLQTDKFKTGCMSATLLLPLERESAAANALIPHVLRRGTESLPDMAALQSRLDALYGASVEPCVRKKGEIQCVGFRASFCNERYIPGQPEITASVASLLGELFLRPSTRGGLLPPEVVENEKALQVQRIEALINDKAGYAVTRLVENMCCYEAFGVRAAGDAEGVEAIDASDFTRHVRGMLACAPVELFYCGPLSHGEMAELFAKAFAGIPRSGELPDLGTDVRMNSVEAAPRIFTEQLGVRQGKLAMGFRLGDCMEEPDPAVLGVLNALFGGCPDSRLFRNVRERLQLCYSVSSMTDLFKGLLIAYAGVDFARFDETQAEILRQLDCIRRGEFSGGELDSAIRFAACSMRSAADSPIRLEDCWLGQNILGFDFGPEETAAMMEKVTARDVAAAAQGIEPDAVYRLSGEEAADE